MTISFELTKRGFIGTAGAALAALDFAVLERRALADHMSKPWAERVPEQYRHFELVDSNETVVSITDPKAEVMLRDNDVLSIRHSFVFRDEHVKFCAWWRTIV